MKKRYARAKLIKKKNEEENKITKWDKVKPWLILAIYEIILIFLCLIICWVYLQKGENMELKIGQKVNAKILNIDEENKKIELTKNELEGTSNEYKEEI